MLGVVLATLGLQPTTTSYIHQSTMLAVPAPALVARGRTPVALLQPHVPDFVDLAHDLAFSADGWTLGLGCVLFGVGQTFETGTHALKHVVPRSLLPVVEQVIGEIATLGFTGLLVGVVQSQIGGWLEQISEYYLGPPDELIEIFEGIDHAIFPVTVAFMLSCALLVGVVAKQFSSYGLSRRRDILMALIAEDEKAEACSLDDEGPSCFRAKQSARKVNGLLLSSLVIDGRDGTRTSPLDPFKDLFTSAEARRAEFLRFRARFVDRANADGLRIPDDFNFGRYLTDAAAANLKGLVSVEPVSTLKVWVPTLLTELVVLQCFYYDPPGGSVLPLLVGLAQLPLGVWAIWNYVRLWHIKSMLTPQLGYYPTPTATVQGDEAPPLKLLPPKYSFLDGAFIRDSPVYNRIALLERAFSAQASNRHEEVFGMLGTNGPSFYLSSMQLALFSAVLSFAFIASGGTASFSTEVANTVASVLAGDAEQAWVYASLVPTLKTVALALTLMPSVGTVLLAPFTFICYNWVTSVEALRRGSVVEGVVRVQRSERFRSTLFSLASLADWIESALSGHASMMAPGLRAGGAPVMQEVRRRTDAEVQARWEVLLETEATDRLLDVRAMFDSQDIDSSGSIGIDELAVIVRELGFTPPPAALQHLFANIDTDGSGEVSFKEFATAVVPPKDGSSLTGTGSLVEAAPRLFAFFDTDGGGTICQAEMLQKLSGLGFDQRGVGDLFQEIGDPKNQGGANSRVISWTQFERYIHRLQEAD